MANNRCFPFLTGTHNLDLDTGDLREADFLIVGLRELALAPGGYLKSETRRH
jgi:hypothetical protein